jgi:lipopolysaccharide/colanic/teichoic acid biosynthesis glycosyltransferase
MKRIFDIVFSIFGIILISPILLIIVVLIINDSRGSAFYLQKRVGKDNQDFKLIKFRTMSIGSDKKGLLTVGFKDSRITRAGGFLRKYKFDELPQLFNVLRGEMSFVGPRPEVRKYVNLYNEDQKKVLSVKPGITDFASIKYSRENEILSKSTNPEKTYIEIIMPDKLKINLEYIEKTGIAIDIKIILRTILKIFMG